MQKVKSPIIGDSVCQVDRPALLQLSIEWCSYVNALRPVDVHASRLDVAVSLMMELHWLKHKTHCCQLAYLLMLTLYKSPAPLKVFSCYYTVVITVSLCNHSSVITKTKMGKNEKITNSLTKTKTKTKK